MFEIYLSFATFFAIGGYLAGVGAVAFSRERKKSRLFEIALVIVSLFTIPVSSLLAAFYMLSVAGELMTEARDYDGMVGDKLRETSLVLVMAVFVSLTVKLVSLSYFLFLLVSL